MYLSDNSKGLKTRKDLFSFKFEGAKMIIITGHPFIDSFIVGMVSVIFFAIYPFYVDATERYFLNPGTENLIFIITGTALGTGIGDFTTYIFVKAFRSFVETHPDNKISQFLKPRLESIDDSLRLEKGTRIFLFAFLSGSLPLNDHVIMSVQGFTKQNRNYVFSGLLIGKFVLATWIIYLGNIIISVTKQVITTAVYWVAAVLTIGMIIIMWKTKDMTMLGFSLITTDLLICAAIILLISYEVSSPDFLNSGGENLFMIVFLITLAFFIISVVLIYGYKPTSMETWRNISITTLIVIGLFIWYGYQTVYQTMTLVLWILAAFGGLVGGGALITSLYIFQNRYRENEHD